MRKVKHLTVNLAVAGSYDVFWALVFVPEGYNPNALFPAGSVNGNPMYEPNQYVMNCGICDPDSGPARFSSRISRNLNSGDRLYLIMDVIPNVLLRCCKICSYSSIKRNLNSKNKGCWPAVAVPAVP